VIAPSSLEEEAAMKTLLFAVVLIVLAVAGVGFWQGWFEVGGKKEDNKIHADLNVNVDKLKQDKESLKKLLAEKTRVMKDKLAGLKEKSKDLSGAAKARAEEEIALLSKKHENLSARMKEVEESTAEKLEDLKKSITDEHASGTADNGTKEGDR
jgi:hypothetical protein